MFTSIILRARTQVDEHLKVCGAANIYAVGDCVAGSDKPLLQDVDRVFKECVRARARSTVWGGTKFMPAVCFSDIWLGRYDKDGNGSLDAAETQNFFSSARATYPHLAFHINQVSCGSPRIITGFVD